MGTLKKYRQYNQEIKLAVAQSKNPYLFPELKIPRTTALYWIKKTQKLEAISSTKVESERIQLLEFQVEQQNALLKLVRKVRCIYPHSFNANKFISKSQRENIVKAIQHAAHWNLIKDCLKIIGLSKRIYSHCNCSGF